MSAATCDGREQGVIETKVRVLVVPGFVADTYSEIERGLVELSANVGADLEFMWLVPEISWKYNRFWRPENRRLLNEPVWVPYLRHHGIRYVVGNVSKYNFVSNFLLFHRILTENRIDAVYTHFGFERFWAAFFGKLEGKVVIWHERWHSLGTRYVVAKQLFYRLFVDEFIAISRFIRGTLPSGRRVYTVPNATRTDIPVPQDQLTQSRLRRQLEVSDDVKVVLMVANFRDWKRHMLALEICQHVLQKRTDVVFIFPGEGELRESFIAKVRSADLMRHVIIPGYADNVDDYYAIADISILTSYYEPFGNVVLEAMRHMVPVVAFDTGGPSEIIQNRETGFLVKDGDVDEFARAILELIEDEQLRVSIGERARQLVLQEYSREKWRKRISELVTEIVSEYRKSSIHGN